MFQFFFFYFIFNIALASVIDAIWIVLAKYINNTMGDGPVWAKKIIQVAPFSFCLIQIINQLNEKNTTCNCLFLLHCSVVVVDVTSHCHLLILYRKSKLTFTEQCIHWTDIIKFPVWWFNIGFKICYTDNTNSVGDFSLSV